MRSLLQVPEEVTIGEDLVCMIYTLLGASSVQVSEYAPYHYQVRENSASMGRRPFQPYQVMFRAARSALETSPERELHIKQLYMMLQDYVLLMHYETFLERSFPFGDLDNRRVALYGAGKFGQEIYRKTKPRFPERIVLWVDRNYAAYQEANMPVKPIDALKEEEFDVVIIALINGQLCEDIKKSLVLLGIEPGKIRYAAPSPEMLEAVKEVLR